MLSLDFQLLSSGDFADENNFVEAFAREIVDVMENEAWGDGKKQEVQVLDDTEDFPGRYCGRHEGLFAAGTAEKLTLSVFVLLICRTGAGSRHEAAGACD